MTTKFRSFGLTARPFYTIKNRLDIEMPISYIYDKLSSDDEAYWSVSPKLSYKYGKSITFFVEGANILNMRHFERLSMDNRNSYIDKTCEQMMPGYFLLGIKLSQ